MRALSHYWRVTRQDMLVAQALLEKAIAIDPKYGQALGVLATTHTFSAHSGWADPTALPIAERAALAAIRVDNEDPWAHLALGHVYLFRRRFDDSLAEFELALQPAASSRMPRFSALAFEVPSPCVPPTFRYSIRSSLRLSDKSPRPYVCGAAALQYLSRTSPRRSRAAGSGGAAWSDRAWREHRVGISRTGPRWCVLSADPCLAAPKDGIASARPTHNHCFRRGSASSTTLVVSSPSSPPQKSGSIPLRSIDVVR
jgi:hypothetical protein